jgi:Domain of unknown function (DUF397)
MGDPMMQDSAFRKSSYSVAQGACVEVGSQFPGMVVIRDSEDVSGARIPLPSKGWRQFISQVKRQDRSER